MRRGPTTDQQPSTRRERRAAREGQRGATGREEPEPAPGLWAGAREVVSRFFEDDAMSLAASLAFYAALSMAPLLMILLWVASLFGEGAQQSAIAEIERLLGGTVARGLEVLLQEVDRPAASGGLAGTIGLLVVLFSASAVFAQLQLALNRVWGVRARPRGAGAVAFVRKRVLSMGVALALGFLLMLSVGFEAALSALDFSRLGVPGSEHLWRAIDLGASLVVFTALFALIYRVFPDAEIEWRDVWFGAVATAVLFMVGKVLTGLYLGQISLGSAYGAAGSFVVMLAWVYFAALAFLLGAELTRVHARRRGRRIEPSDAARRVS